MFIHEYHFMDKSDWGPGPWQDEPDKVQWKDPATGYPCIARRGNPNFGSWCGYVGIDPGHPLYSEDVDYEEIDLDVHGGITFTGTCEEGPEETSICHVPDPGEPDTVLWFGFDCGHAFDLMPSMAARYSSDPVFSKIPTPRDTTYKTLEYVQSECANLARQLYEKDSRLKERSDTMVRKGIEEKYQVQATQEEKDRA